MPHYYKPQHLLDFEDRLPSSAHGSDSLSLNSFNSVTSTNLEWDDSAISPSSEDGDLTDTVSDPRSTASDLTSSKASTKSPTQCHNPFNEEQAEAVSSSDTTAVHTSSQGTEPHPPELLDAGTELEVIRVTKKKKTGKKKKTRADEEVSPLRPASAQHAGARRGMATAGSAAQASGGAPQTPPWLAPRRRERGPAAPLRAASARSPARWACSSPR
ncbi:unnamed protein product [Pipistrellus nathusii]|uniref:Uncharacterized protein n=1 Tax=Pipistrellus nathusii TaxID=59473 RepID=A0ABN9ZXY6_PIPNA